jgi:hypothetical protein
VVEGRFGRHGFSLSLGSLEGIGVSMEKIKYRLQTAKIVEVVVAQNCRC